MTIRREMAEWRATRAMRDEQERRDGRDGQRSSEFWVLSSELEVDKKSGTVRGPKFEGSETSNPDLRSSDRACRAFPASLARRAWLIGLIRPIWLF